MDHSFIVQNLEAGYAKKNILKNVNLEIPDHKISVIIGSNACGKSTLLKTMARLLSPTNGGVYLDGATIDSTPTKKLAQTLGLLPQTMQTPEGVSVADLIARGRFPYQGFFDKMKKEDYEAVDEAMELMGIRELASRNINELSGGQRQRVWIAMALAQQTDILLLDEPTTYLDITHQIEILDLLTDLNHKKGTTIVMVLHDINLSARYADYIFAMRDGELIRHGNCKDVIDEKLIYDVFDLKCQVMNDPISDSPMIIPIGKHHIYKEDNEAADV